MKIIFIGKIEMSFQLLIHLLKLKKKIIGVITDNQRGINSDFVDFVPFCKKKKIDYLCTQNINSTRVEKWINYKKPDYIFCFGWSQLIKSNILKNYKNKIIGFHPSILPLNRGRHPLIWAIILNLSKTASTFFLITKRVDEGAVIDQKIVKISNLDDSKSLYKKVTKVAKSRLKFLIQKISNDKILNHIILNSKEKKNKASNIWRKRNFKDSIIDWRMSSTQIVNLVKALSYPYVGASFLMDGKEYKIWKAKNCRNNKYKNIEYGKVLENYKNGSFIIKCGEGCVKVLKVEPFIRLKKGIYL